MGNWLFRVQLPGHAVTAKLSNKEERRLREFELRRGDLWIGLCHPGLRFCWECFRKSRLPVFATLWRGYSQIERPDTGILKIAGWIPACQNRISDSIKAFSRLIWCSKIIRLVCPQSFRRRHLRMARNGGYQRHGTFEASHDHPWRFRQNVRLIVLVNIQIAAWIHLEWTNGYGQFDEAEITSHSGLDWNESETPVPCVLRGQLPTPHDGGCLFKRRIISNIRG
jgi:hypothetical protein